jgi:type-F conjugative transfer system pilin assembly protein TrbC
VVAVRLYLPILIATLFVPPQHALAKTIVIDTPDLCARVEKVEGNRVDLKETSEPCAIEGPGKASIQIGDVTIEIDVYLNGAYWRKYSIGSPSLSTEDVADVIKGAKQCGEKLSVPESPHKTEALRIAEDLSRYFQSNEFQERIESEKARLYGEIYGSPMGGYYSETSGTSRKIERLSPQERIYLFISSSVPIHTLRHYVKAVSAIMEPNIRIVMSGFIGGAKFVKPTVAFLKDILFVDPECDPGEERCNTYSSQVIIDPLLFRRYHVERVPAFVYVPSVSIADSQMSEGLENNGTVSDHYLVYGDVSFEYALRLFSKERKSPGLEGLLTACRE